MTQERQTDFERRHKFQCMRCKLDTPNECEVCDFCMDNDEECP